jgi:plastocyanin
MTDIDQTGDARMQPRWARLASLGLVLAALGPLLILLGAVLWGLNADDLPFFVIATVVGLVGAALVWRFGAWAKWMGIVAGLLVAGALFWTAFGLFVPQSFFDFVPGVLVLPGAILAIASCIGAIVAGRRGHRTAAPEGGERRGIRIAIGGVAILAVLSAILTITSRSSVGDASGASALVEMKDFEFTQDRYSVAAGSTVQVKNDDPFFHTFTVDALDIDVDFTVGSSKLVEIPAQPGTYVLYCTLHTSDPEHPSKDDMAATLNVT